MNSQPKPFDFLTPLTILCTGSPKFCGNLHISGNAWKADPREGDPAAIVWDITAITFEGSNIFGLYEFDKHMRAGFSIDVDKAVCDHCEGLWPVGEG